MREVTCSGAHSPPRVLVGGGCLDPKTKPENRSREGGVASGGQGCVRAPSCVPLSFVHALLVSSRETAHSTPHARGHMQRRPCIASRALSSAAVVWIRNPIPKIN